MATLLQMRDAVYRQLRDSAKTFIVPADVTAWINEAQRDLAHRLELVQASVSSTTSGNTIAFPNSNAFVRILSVRLGTDDVEWVDDDQWFSYSDDALDSTVTIARTFNNTIELYPTPDTGTAYTIRYVKEPADLSADGDISTLPAETHIKMIQHAIAQGLYKSKRPNEAQVWDAKYEKGLPANPLGINKRLPGPMVLTFEPSVWDIDGAHL